MSTANERSAGNLAGITPDILGFALEIANDAVYIFDEHRRIIYANTTASAMTGYRPNELMQMHLSQLVADYALPDRAEVLQRAEDRTRLLFESIHLHKSGFAVPVEVSLSVAPFAGKLYNIAFVRDVTTRKHREHELEQFRQIVDTSPVALLICERGNGVIRYANALAQRLFSELRQDSTAVRLEDLFGGFGVDHGFSQRLISGQEFQNRELQLQFAAHTAWVSLNSRNMLLDGQESVCLAMTDVTEAHELSNQLSYHATYDDLTGLLNRREFEDRLQEVIDLGRDSTTENLVCFLDLDQFKVINDSCGHMAGDEMLRQIAVELSASLRRDDTLARLGGDEFAILLENCTLQNAERIANKVCNTVQDYRFVWNESMFRVGVSIGIAQINTGDTMTEVLRRADAACYAAKEAGRNRVQVFSHDDAGLAHRHNEMRWVSRINAALDAGRFQLWAQEIAEINHDTDQPSRNAGSHFEVLLRMQDSDGALVQPGDFFPAAERYDLAPKIDRWVIRRLFDWLAANPSIRKKVSLCAINVSGQTLNDISFQREVIAMLEATHLPADSLCFEVTETSAIANLTATSHFMRRLKEHGCTFALDDFGRGLSSFAYLKSLPVDFVKIDGFFVKDILTDPVDRAMVKAIIDMAHALCKKTIAEFVENEEILEQLIDLKIDYVQGYGIARPMQLL
jgi:diguanylate cyclase (GGDEF)-like protein/PAS domain S-box-containing protein